MCWDYVSFLAENMLYMADDLLYLYSAVAGI